MSLPSFGRSTCCAKVRVLVEVEERCFDPGKSTPSLAYGVTASITVSFGGAVIFTSPGSGYFRVSQAGDYTVTIDVPGLGTQTQTVTLTPGKANQVVVFYFDRHPTPGCNCFCDVPQTLSMVSNDPSCNYGMFQSCTIQWGPPPPAMQQFGYTGNVFTSAESFTDPITGSEFFYYFACQYNQFFLTRIFPTSPFGSPYRDGYLYNWVVGGYGNTCDPFQLEVGTPFPGSDASCSVQVTAATAGGAS